VHWPLACVELLVSNVILCVFYYVALIINAVYVRLAGPIIGISGTM